MAIEPIALLARTFPSIAEADLIQLASLARQTTYPAGTILCHEDAYEMIFYLVSEGACDITKRINDQEQLILRHCGPGDFFGEMAIIQDAPRSATVITTEETTVIEIDKEVFVRALSRNPSLALEMVRTTFDRIRANDKLTISEMQHAYETLERLDRAKLDFIEVTAHELRTPLTVMRGYASMLLTDPLIKESPMLRDMTEGLVSGTQRLYEIVNNMLDVQRINMDQPSIASVPVSLPVVLRGLNMQFREAVEERHLNLEMDIAQDANIIYIEADPGLISKALYHVLINAIKYTPDGGTIRVTLRYEEDARLGWVAHIAIADTGIGIDKQHHLLIFEKFYRLGDVALHSSGKTQFKAGGPGLGLAIARGTVDVHGGAIWVESPGHDEEIYPGSIFHLLLPVKRRPPHRESLLDARSVRG